MTKKCIMGLMMEGIEHDISNGFLYRSAYEETHIPAAVAGCPAISPDDCHDPFTAGCINGAKKGHICGDTLSLFVWCNTAVCPRDFYAG